MIKKYGGNSLYNKYLKAKKMTFLQLWLIAWSIFKKKLKWESFKLKIEKKIYKKKYSTEDIISLMKSMGMKKGSNVFIHSSFNQFYNYKGTIIQFIDAILAEIGTEGTLAMPAYRLLKNKNEIFDIKKTPTQAGLIAEIFRRYPGVKRSIDARHSVCALGPMSDYLLDEHQYTDNCFGEKGPYYKLSKIKALVFIFGLGKFFLGTIVHCAEGMLKDEIPYFSMFFRKKVTCKFKLLHDSIYEKEYYSASDDLFIYRSNLYKYKFIRHYYDKSKYRMSRISNLTVNMYEADYCINRLIELGRKGIVLYQRPKPLKKLFIKVNN